MDLEIGGMYYAEPSIVSKTEIRVIVTDIFLDGSMIRYKNLQDMDIPESAMTTNYFKFYFKKIEDAPVWDRVKAND